MYGVRGCTATQGGRHAWRPYGVIAMFIRSGVVTTAEFNRHKKAGANYGAPTKV